MRMCQILKTSVFLSAFASLSMHVSGLDSDKGDHARALDLKNTLFIVLSQPDDFHVKEAENFKAHFHEQLKTLDKAQWPRLLMTHEDFVDLQGAWTIFPLIEHIVTVGKSQPISWVFICEDDTRVKLNALYSLLSQLDSSQSHFLGRELRDEETTIIHHFAFADNPRQFAYPDFRAGFVLSWALVSELHGRLQITKQRTDFSIDPKHELAMFIWDEGNGPTLTHLKEFCSSLESSEPWCVTTQASRFPECGPPVSNDDIAVAVKTCGHFHKSRVPVVKATWGHEAEIIEYFSEVKDDSIPTVDLGVPNTERGHCGKTMAIIHRVSKHPDLIAIPWLLIADDDTIINLDQLRSLLACYRSDQPVALGERYGYGLVRGGGYDYITGGGGMVFSRPAIQFLAERCRCYSDDAPDDMTLGMCLKNIGIPVTHSRFFHQARPNDYSPAFLANQIPVSFHKHWNTDPLRVYADLIAAGKAHSESVEAKKKKESKDEL
ncbi:beta-1,3-glucosyltransferase [Plakobranchus ocellatus]|uniref:Beta-1,3-glucosyltransferase n=1 Tax=Plakobranchus ocellatus TaxID=259542 RepID=A0AAV4DG64_9GAST|nr:beta-1,3-glucosyltransferase [Plakobranchus ocellatus]